MEWYTIIMKQVNYFFNYSAIMGQLINHFSFGQPTTNTTEVFSSVYVATLFILLLNLQSICPYKYSLWNSQFRQLSNFISSSSNIVLQTCSLGESVSVLFCNKIKVLVVVYKYFYEMRFKMRSGTFQYYLNSSIMGQRFFIRAL